MTRVKICGLRTADDLLAAAHAGADLCGLVFVPGRRRRVPVEAAVEAVRAFRAAWPRTRPAVVGLFADQPLEEVQETVRRVGLDAVQLCGGEPLAYCKAVGAPVLKVLPVDDALPRQELTLALGAHLAALEREGFGAVLDRYERGLQGGTGRSFDWGVAAELARGHRFLLAGGLTPENVAQAVARVRPWGVDVSSGVETHGVKDHARVRAFIAAVREADITLSEAKGLPSPWAC